MAIIALHLSRVLYKSTLFMQNKPNLLNAQMNVTSAITMNYEQLTMNYANKNKPNSKPIKANTKPKQTQFPANNFVTRCSWPVSRDRLWAIVSFVRLA